MSTLTHKQSAFVAEYLVDMNATQAAIRAGYSKKTAQEQSSRLLSNVKVRAAIDAAMKERTERAGLTADMVYQSIVRELQFDPARLLNEDGSPKMLHEIDADTRKGLAGIETIQIGSDDVPAIVRKYKWQNPSSARDQAAKILGLYKADNDQKNDPVRDLLNSLSGNVLGPKSK